MLGGIFKLTLFLNVLFLFITLLWQAAITDASPILPINNNLAESNEDVSHLLADNNRGGPVVKRSLHSTVDQQSLIDSSRFRSRHHRLRKKKYPTKLKYSPDIFQSTGDNDRASARIQTIIDDRLKRFRMLDPDEFQEMLQSLSHQMPAEKTKDVNNIDTLDGMQLENYWSRK